MRVADRACNRYLHRAVAQAHSLWDAAARVVDAARPHCRRAEQERCEAIERQQVTRKLVAERRRRKREAVDKRQTNARRVALKARQETWERGRQLVPSTISRQRRCHRHQDKGDVKGPAKLGRGRLLQGTASGGTSGEHFRQCSHGVSQEGEHPLDASSTATELSPTLPQSKRTGGGAQGRGGGN